MMETFLILRNYVEKGGWGKWVKKREIIYRKIHYKKAKEKRKKRGKYLIPLMRPPYVDTKGGGGGYQSIKGGKK